MATINDIPQGDFDQIKRRLITQIESMDDAELQIIARAKDSLGYFIAEAFRSMAKLLGYIIALPIAWGMKFAESLYKGFQGGWDAAFESAGF